MNKIYLLLGSVLFFFSCSQDKLIMTEIDIQLRDAAISASSTGTLNYWVLHNGDTELDKIPQDPKNPLLPEKVELGKLLFYETGIAVDAIYESGRGTYSCSSCHIPEAGWKPGRQQGIADGGLGFGNRGEARLRNQEYKESEMDIQTIRPLGLINAAYSGEVALWNGQAGAVGPNEGTEHLWEVDSFTFSGAHFNKLGFHGIESTNFQGVITHRFNINKEMLDSLGYTDLFDQAFPDLSEEERYSNFGLALALAAYLRSLTTDDAPFQKWLKGDMDAMTYEQKQGALTFFTKANCTACHSGKAFSATNFFALGVNDLDMSATFFEDKELKEVRNLGRGGFTKNEEDNYKFKVPTLYNLKNSGFFFHGSSASSLEEVIEYKDKAVGENPRVPKERISSLFKPLYLTEEEKANLVEFLRNGLFDATVFEQHVPDSTYSGKCFPNNDEMSKAQICGK